MLASKAFHIIMFVIILGLGMAFVGAKHFAANDAAPVMDSAE